MPVNVVKTPHDEHLWEEAKKQASKQGKAEDWKYVMGIFQHMKKSMFPEDIDMDKLDLLISRLKEVREDLAKAGPLHNTVEGFASGLKALPRGSAERGQFITQHMNHGPFLQALQSHPQGAQLHSQLTGIMNGRNATAAGAGTKVSTGMAAPSTVGVGAPTTGHTMDPAMMARLQAKASGRVQAVDFPAQVTAHQARITTPQARTGTINSPGLSAALRNSPPDSTAKMPTPAEHAVRAAQYDMAPKGYFGKSLIKIASNGQWSFA